MMKNLGKSRVFLFRSMQVPPIIKKKYSYIGFVIVKRDNSKGIRGLYGAGEKKSFFGR
jgi:hypothetical protein